MHTGATDTGYISSVQQKMMKCSHIMDNHMDTLAQNVSEELAYEPTEAPKIRDSLGVVYGSFAMGGLMSLNIYIWVFCNLSLFTLIGGLGCTYFLYCQMATLYCRVRSLQDGVDSRHHRLEVSKMRTYILNGMYAYVWGLLDFIRVGQTPSDSPLPPPTKLRVTPGTGKK